MSDLSVRFVAFSELVDQVASPQPLAVPSYENDAKLKGWTSTGNDARVITLSGVLSTPTPLAPPIGFGGHVLTFSPPDVSTRLERQVSYGIYALTSPAAPTAAITTTRIDKLHNVDTALLGMEILENVN